MQPNPPDRIDAILDSLEGMERANPAPFLHTRLMARMERERSGGWSQAMEWLSRPAVAIGLSLLFVLLNGTVLFSDADVTPGTAENAMAVVQDYDVSFAAELEPLTDDVP